MNSTNCSKCSDDFTYQFWERLRKVRETRGLTQARVAGELGYDVKRYNNYETNRIPNIEDIIRIADILDCDVEYLCGMQGDYFRRDNKTIAEITGLSQEASESLAKIDDPERMIFDKLLKDKHSRFFRLLFEIWQERIIYYLATLPTLEAIEAAPNVSYSDFTISNILRDMYHDIDIKEIHDKSKLLGMFDSPSDILE